MTFDSLNYDATASAESEGFTLAVSCEHDSDHGAPWEEEDGHGPVSDWRTFENGKMPGELVLCKDHGQARFYDFAEACRIALKDGWNAAPYSDSETPKQRAAKAARADFEHLRAWCNNDWTYCGMIVTASKDGIKLGSASLWGIARDYPGDDGSYLLEVANELAPEAIEEAKARLESLCDCAD